MNLTITVEGRERYPVNIRYARELRNDIEKLKRVLIPIDISKSAAMGSSSVAQIPLGELADIKIVRGPTSIKSEEGLLTAYVSVFFTGRDVGSYVEEVKKKVASNVKLPAGYRLEWSGEYEYLVKTQERLKLVIPLTLLIIFLLIYMNTKSTTKTIIILLPCRSLWSALLAPVYPELQHEHCGMGRHYRACRTGCRDRGCHAAVSRHRIRSVEKDGRMNNIEDLKDAIMHGAVKRIRPKLMTVGVILAGLIPIMFSHGTGADVMKRIAAPMIGGVITSEILELTIYPAIYLLWKGRKFKINKAFSHEKSLTISHILSIILLNEEAVEK